MLFTKREIENEIKRELALRKRVYANMITTGNLPKEQANKAYCAMQAALRVVEKLDDSAVIDSIQPKQ